MPQILNASMSGMLAMVVLVGLGEKMAERFVPLYLLALGGAPFIIGVFNALQVLLGALYSFPGGWLSERFGYKRALALFNLTAMTGYAVVLLAPRWWAVLAGSVLFIAWTAISLPAIMSLVAHAVPERHRTMGVTLHSLVRRIPMALGPILGGLAIGHWGLVTGIRVAFGMAIVLSLVALVLQARFISEPPARQPMNWGVFRRFPPALRTLLVSDILVRFAEQMPYAYVVVWVVQLHGHSELQFGVLTAIEMATAVLVYVPVAWLADRWGKRPFVGLTFAFFTLFPAVLYFSEAYPALVAAFVIRGLKEFGEPARKALILDLAIPEAKAGMFGAYYLVRDTVVAAGALAGAFLWDISPGANLLVATLCGACGTALFVLRRNGARDPARSA
jgi:MFS family permease